MSVVLLLSPRRAASVKIKELIAGAIAVNSHPGKTVGFTITQVDAFTDQPFAGNPAAVCLLSEPQSADWMQRVAREMNLSETAFLLPLESGFSLRWFTPAIEVDLCGHATLASAHVLWSEGHLAPDQAIQFHTQSGVLTAQRQAEWIELNFPARPCEAVSRSPSPALVKAMGAPMSYLGKAHRHYLVEVPSETVVRQLQPDFQLLKTVDAQGVIVTSRADASSPYDFVSRYFAPAAGVDEDPVTGSAHCALGPFWRDRLGQDQFVAYQASARGGLLKVRCEGDRVYLGGQAVTVLRGELLPSQSVSL